MIQYDLGKHTVDGFKRVGSLNRPPEELLATVSKLRSNFEMETSSLTTHLAGLPQKFKRPQAADRLFDADYLHPSPTTSCDDCDQTKLLSRKDRSSDEPEVFYGTIASGNSVIKDARLRDDLHEKYNVLCFEMEAAGLMNNFTCIVVRGVCDYSDSHKMDQWRVLLPNLERSGECYLSTNAGNDMPLLLLLRGQRNSSAPSSLPQSTPCPKLLEV